MTTELTEPAGSTTAGRDREPSRDDLSAHYRLIRETSERLCDPLETEDYVAQSMPDASPAKWHLAHTSWFFETFVLKPAHCGQDVSPGDYAFLFNSYYNALGERISRDRRGLLTRPTVAQVRQYRARVDDAVGSLLSTADPATLHRLAPLLILGLHHEQQHQELILTDLKHLFGSNPGRPVYRALAPSPAAETPSLTWFDYPEGLGEIGHVGGSFGFDNEGPRHRVFVEPYRLANRLVTNGEYLEFLDAGGYERPEFWLSDGWNARQAHDWSAPLYWRQDGHRWRVFTLGGEHDLDEAEPVCHISFYEADAFARWAGARLPTEAEWELAADGLPVAGHFQESASFHPRPLATLSDSAPLQLFGDVWEWTCSPYVPYPGFRPAAGALGEYNGKFMCNQMVLRGGSCVTPGSHVRASYRNFFPPDARWQFSGLRLAQDG